jgi:hypothetical protein
LTLRKKSIALALAGFFCFTAAALRAEDPAPEAKKKPELLPRMLAKLDAEPLIALCAENLRIVPEKFATTHFNKMLQDPTYDKGRNYLRALINHYAGGDIAALWPDFAQQLSGPAALAVLPKTKDAAADDPDFRLVMAVLTPNAESAQKLRAHWPKVAPQSGTLLAAVRLVTILETDLPAEDAVPAWAKSDAWPKGDLSLRASPHKLGKTLRPWLEQGAGESLDFIAIWLTAIRDEDVERLGVGLTFAGEMFNEELQMDLIAGHRNAFTRLVESVREKPSAWDAILGATPGDDDLILLAQCNFAALEGDRAFATQAMERYLRGKRWSRTKGRMAEALDPERFSFLLQKIQGSFGLVAKPTASGDLRLVTVAALKGENGAPLDIETLRGDLTKSLEKIGAEFETLQNARKIGGAAPLGALFQGRGLFTTPVIGLSPGWLWLCSGTAAYQDVTSAFKNGRTLALEMAPRPPVPNAPPKKENWAASDAIRLQIDLEKVLKLAYAAWLLSGAEGPFIGPWKVPGELLPQPGVFTGHLGTLRTRLSRQGTTLTANAAAAIPLTSFLLPSLLQEAADTIENTRRDTKQIEAQDKALNEETAPAPNLKAQAEEKK